MVTEHFEQGAEFDWHAIITAMKNALLDVEKYAPDKWATLAAGAVVELSKRHPDQKEFLLETAATIALVAKDM